MLKKHYLIIGGTRGIGREIAKTALKEEHIVSVIGRHAPKDSAKLAKITYYICNITDTKVTNQTVTDIINKRGKISHLIFCQRFRGTDDHWQGEFDTSLTATKNIIEYTMDKFDNTKEKSIILISSIISNLVSLEQPASYHIAKAGINALTRYYAVILGPKGIRVNSILPGTTLKYESEDFYLNNKPLIALYKQIIPLGRMGTSQDIANVVSFLCSEKSSFITGQNIIVDGGLFIQNHEFLTRSLKSLVHPQTKKLERMKDVQK